MSLFLVSLPVICVSFCTSTILFWLLELCNIIWNQGAWCLETALASLGLLTVLTRIHESKPDFSLRLCILSWILRINKDLQSQALTGWALEFSRSWHNDHSLCFQFHLVVLLCSWARFLWRSVQNLSANKSLFPF